MSGPVAGGTTVAIKGSGFVTGATVAIGGVATTGVVVGGPTSLTAVTGAHATGLPDVTVAIPGRGRRRSHSVFPGSDSRQGENARL